MSIPQALNSSLLTLDPEERGPFKRVASFGFNTCHAPLVMRSDLQEQMSRAHRELGMRFWRCHGTLSDDVGIVVQDSKGRVDYAFSGLKRIFDAGLRCGLKPFLELSFMPSALARDPSEIITHYRGITSPPKDWKAWERLIERLLRFLLETYGAPELRRWRFEVWNEPNIPFWTGTQAEYFQLYRTTALAIKKADAQLQVGGPATARAEWVGDLLRYCRNTRTPIDFVSVHIYPSDVAFADSAAGDVKLLGTDFLRDSFRAMRREVDASGLRLPIIWGEWNSSAGPMAENHDTCNNAALICSALAGIEEFGEGSLFWNLSDIYEECEYHFTPFHGGYGLYTVDHIAKSAARAFSLWQALKGEQIVVRGLPATATRGAFATHERSGNRLGVVLWNHAETEEKAAPWRITLAGEFSARRPPHVVSIEPGRGSAYETWLAQGKPLNLTAVQRRQLERASQPRTLAPLIRNGAIHLSIPSGSAIGIFAGGA